MISMQGKRRMRFSRLIALLTVLDFALSPNVVMAEESGNPAFGGPNATENIIEEDAAEKGGFFEKRISQPWFDWKKKIRDEHGLSLGVDYSAVYLQSSENGVSGEDDAASGMVRFYGSWDLVGRGTKSSGAFVWKVEHRHKYTNIAPKAFGFDQGMVGLIVPPFSDEGTRWTNLFWRQRLNDGKVVLTGGLLDATDYVDVFALASPWTGFLNFAFSTGTTTIFIPNDATAGIAAGAMLTDKLYMIGGITNAYSDPTDPLDGLSDFFSDKEYFTSIELGWTQSQDRIYLDNTHVTLWHVDDSVRAGTPGGWGSAFQYVTFVNNNLMPFVRGGYADDGGTLMQKSVSVGFAYQEIAGRDVLGIGLNWGEVNENTFASGLKDQTSLEAYYRFQLTEQFALTPDIQYIKDPPLNPAEDSLWIVGLRARLAL
jgi:porin